MNKKPNDIFDRILQIIDYKGISKRRLTDKIGVSSGYFNTVNDIGGAKLSKILNEFPEISSEWLLTGCGEMLKFKDSSNNQSVVGNKNMMAGKNISSASNDSSKDIKELKKQIKDKDDIIKELLNQQKKLIDKL